MPRQSVSALKAAIAKGPTSVSVQADKTVFHSYTGGIIDSAECGTATNHAIVAVGYGSENGKDYYIIRNSWSSTWGEEGYVRLAAVEGKGICGVQVHPSVAYV
jgi:C1A family cysteine protease